MRRNRFDWSIICCWRETPVVRGREPVVEDQGHPLDQGVVGADHPVEPPEVVVAPGVGGGDRVAVAVDRRRPVEHGRALGAGQRVDRGLHPLLRQRLRLTGPRPEPGPVEQPGRLEAAEWPAVDLEPGGRRRGAGSLRPGNWPWPGPAVMGVRWLVGVADPVGGAGDRAVAVVDPLVVLVAPALLLLRASCPFLCPRAARRAADVCGVAMTAGSRLRREPLPGLSVRSPPTFRRRAPCLDARLLGRRGPARRGGR